MRRAGESRSAEVGRFAVVGLAAYATDLAVFNALLLGGVPSVAAKVTSGAVAIAVAFAGSRWWTWRVRRGPDVGREYLLFLLFSVVAAGIQVGCLVVSRQVLGLRDPVSDNVSANVVGMALATAFRFWTFRTYVFRHDPPTAPGHLRALPDGDPATPRRVGPRRATRLRREHAERAKPAGPARSAQSFLFPPVTGRRR